MKTFLVIAALIAVATAAVFTKKGEQYVHVTYVLISSMNLMSSSSLW